MAEAGRGLEAGAARPGLSLLATEDHYVGSEKLRRRAAVHHLMTVIQVSERFACRVTGQHRATQRHRMRGQTRTDPDAALRAWLRRWARDHPRWGFRRAYHSARAEGWIVNHKKVQPAFLGVAGTGAVRLRYGCKAPPVAGKTPVIRRVEMN
jgi:hypothetical protein